MMYVSDFGYATSGNYDQDRSTCLFGGLYEWNPDTRYFACYENDWLLNERSEDKWFITYNSSDDKSIWLFSSDPFLADRSSSDSYDVHPALYLASDVQIASGTGTDTDPFILK